MKTKQAFITAFALFGALVIFTLAVYEHLPDKMPIHWNLRGEVNG
jgi:uncharacterized membrane protein